MKTKISFIFVMVLTTIIGCKAPTPVLSKLHTNLIGNDTTSNLILDVRVGLTPFKASVSAPEKPQLLWELQDSLPHHLIKVIAAKATNPDEIVALMSKPVRVQKEDPPKELPSTYTEYKVRLVFSNIKRYFIDKRFTHPNTRMAYLNTYVTIPETENRIAFQSIDKMENEFEEIDLGNISRTQSVTFNAKLTATGQIGTSVDNTNTNSSDTNRDRSNGNEKKVYDENGNVIGTVNNAGKLTSVNKSSNTTTTKNGASANATGELAYQNAETISEARQVKLQRMKTGFSFAPHEIVVSQEGRQNGDISNNVFVDAMLKFNGSDLTNEKKVYTFKNLLNDSFQPNEADKLLFSKRLVSYVKCSDAKPIILQVKFEGQLRAVESLKEQPGDNALEYDDKVTMYHLPKKDGANVKIDPFLFCKYVYKVMAQTEDKAVNLRIFWRSDEELNFFSDDKPEEFLGWLKLMIDKGDPKSLSTEKFTMYFETGPNPNDRIYVTKKEMKPEDIRKLKALKDIQLEVRTN